MKKLSSNRSFCCPHCENRDSAFLQDNGDPPKSFDYTLLCVARVAPEDRSWDHVKPLPEDLDADGKVACGMQWCPNEYHNDGWDR